jgi:DNA-binding Lrp family transcriptional regulator
VDRIDFALLEHLQRDGRASNKELAAEVGLSASSCHERLKRLNGAGVIKGVHAALDPRAVGVGLEAMISLQLRDQSRMPDVWDGLLALREVRAVFHLAGAVDLLVHVAVRDADHLREVAVMRVAVLPGIGHIETALVFDAVERRALPLYAAP